MDNALVNGSFFNASNTQPTSNSNGVLALFSLKGKTAIVTGSGAGIGLAVANTLAEAGANVALFYNTNEKAVDRAAEIEKKFGVKGTGKNKLYIYKVLTQCI